MWTAFIPPSLGLHFGSKKLSKISIVFEDLSRNSVIYRTEVKPYPSPIFIPLTPQVSAPIKYATTVTTASIIKDIAKDVDVNLQQIVVRNDSPVGGC